MIACNDNVYYKQSIDIEDAAWPYGKILDFEFEITDTSAYYDLVLDVKHDIDFTYENTYVKIKTLFPSGEEVTDQVSLQLADELDQWEGDCSGNSCTVSILLQNEVFFKEAGSYKLAIEQFNRVDPLEGIESMELKIISVEK
jgi:gliding motility-associated lipoprotein GldH